MRSQIYLIPISDSIFNSVHLKAKQEKMPETLKIENKYQPWYSIRFAGVNDNNSVSDNKNKYWTDNETKSVSTEYTTSFTSDDGSYTPYKDGNKTSTQQTSNT